MSEATCANCDGAIVPAKPMGFCPHCDWIHFPDTAGPRVLVVHENREIAREIGEVLSIAGFSPAPVRAGSRAVALAPGAAAVVLDVGIIEDLLAFQVIEQAKSEDPSRPVVLVASVYNKTAYKRRPQNLYGADDYVEQHHIADLLPQKLCALLDIDPVGVAALIDASEVDERSEVIRDATYDAGGDEGAAYSVVADIALYFQQDFERAAAGERTAELAGALQEGAKVLAKLSNIEEAIASKRIESAFESFISEFGN